MVIGKWPGKVDDRNLKLKRCHIYEMAAWSVGVCSEVICGCLVGLSAEPDSREVHAMIEALTMTVSIWAQVISRGVNIHVTGATTPVSADAGGTRLPEFWASWTTLEYRL